MIEESRKIEFKVKPQMNPRGSREGARGAAREGPKKKVPNYSNQRISKQVAKKYQEKAHISALISSNKSFAMQRLMRDYNGIKNQTVPVAGVIAHPLEDNFFEWHGNIKANAQNIYKGAVLHFKFVFPANYPLKGPKILLLNESVHHPNIMPGGRICLDILEDKKELYKGWTSAYTVLSILLQLQNFFFEVDENVMEDKVLKKQITAAVRAMNEFNCKTCKHKGTTNPWPDFIKNDQDPSLHVMSQSKYQEALLQELVCYHRKTTFNETPLGLGINILKIPRTGEIKGLVPVMDFVSLKAYTKEQLRRSMSGEKFTHWFPLYFGVKQEQFLHLCTRSLSMISTGNTRQFSPEMVLKIMPKFFTNLVADIVSEKTYTSCRALKILMYVYRVCLLLISTYPVAKDEVEARLYKFINDPSSRHKDFTASLGDLLTLLTLSSNHKIEEILAAYIEEQMDRQIFWILQALPDFEDLINSSTVDDIRAKVCFKAGIVGHQILLFYYYFIKKVLFKDQNDLNKIADNLDAHHSNLTNDKIDSHQKEIQKILKIDSYRDYYKFMNLTPPSDKELNDKLKQAYMNSLNKGYHGKDEVRFVPDESEQIKMFLQKFPGLDKISDGGKLLPDNDPIWRELVMEKFDYVSRLRFRYPAEVHTPFSVAKYFEKNFLNYTFNNVNNAKTLKPKGEILKMFNGYKYSGQNGDQAEDDKYLQTLSWRQLYLKSFLETYVKYFKYIADFKTLYSLLDLCANEIVHFNLHISLAENLKSDYNYVRVILGKLSKLKHLSIILTESLNLKMIKNILKGVNNFNSNGGELSSLKIWTNQNISIYSHKDHNMLTIIDKLPHLKVLDVSGTKVDQNAALRIRNHLYYFKTIEVLNLSDCKLTDEMAKEIADGIMKAKSLEKIYLKGNKMVKGLASVLYNLAFQPSLKVIDISQSTGVDCAETGTALYKLIKMSQSLEVLIASKVPNLVDKLTNEFFYSLGDNSSLRYLDLSESGSLGNNSNHCKHLGSAVSLNALKNGALRTLIISNLNLKYKNFVDFIEGMHVSEETHFQWYGTPFDAFIQKDSKEYFFKKFYCKLNHLDLEGCIMDCTVNINDLKQNQVNHLRTLLENTPGLELLNLSSARFSKLFVDMLVNALHNPNGIKHLNMENSNLIGDFMKNFINNTFYKENEKKNKVINGNIHLEALNLAKNNFGYSGIEAISNMLKENKTIRILNLYKNIFDVNGARRLKEALLVNNTLETLDIGYNRIKDLGFSNIISALVENPNNRVTFLSSRYNFIKNNCLYNSVEKILKSDNAKMSTLELWNNSFDEKTLLKVYNEVYINSPRKFRTEIFETLYYLTPEKLERTAWISPLSYSVFSKDIKKALTDREVQVIDEDNSHLGIPLNITIRRGRRLGEKKTTQTVDAFVEFIHPNSVNRLLKVAATGGFFVDGKKFRVYKAGTKPERLLLKKKKNGPPEEKVG